MVFRGDNIRDQDGCLAIFNEQGTSSSHFSAAKILDAIARLPGNHGQDSGGSGAYTQAALKGVETWVCLPRDRWRPESHPKYANPVVRLQLAACGHPPARSCWEKHCEKAIGSCGFRSQRVGMPSCSSSAAISCSCQFMSMTSNW